MVETASLEGARNACCSWPAIVTSHKYYKHEGCWRGDSCVCLADVRRMSAPLVVCPPFQRRYPIMRALWTKGTRRYAGVYVRQRSDAMDWRYSR